MDHVSISVPRGPDNFEHPCSCHRRAQWGSIRCHSCSILTLYAVTPMASSVREVRSSRVPTRGTSTDDRARTAYVRPCFDTSPCHPSFDAPALYTLDLKTPVGIYIVQELDAALEPILLQQKFKQGGQDMIRLGDNTVPYNEQFRLLMITKLPNPEYAPEVQVSLLRGLSAAGAGRGGNYADTAVSAWRRFLGVFVWSPTYRYPRALVAPEDHMWEVLRSHSNVSHAGKGSYPPPPPHALFLRVFR